MLAENTVCRVESERKSELHLKDTVFIVPFNGLPMTLWFLFSSLLLLPMEKKRRQKGNVQAQCILHRVIADCVSDNM